MLRLSSSILLTQSPPLLFLYRLALFPCSLPPVCILFDYGVSLLLLLLRQVHHVFHLCLKIELYLFLTVCSVLVFPIAFAIVAHFSFLQDWVDKYEVLWQCPFFLRFSRIQMVHPSLSALLGSSKVFPVGFYEKLFSYFTPFICLDRCQ